MTASSSWLSPFTSVNGVRSPSIRCQTLGIRRRGQGCQDANLCLGAFLSVPGYLLPALRQDGS